MHQEEERLSQAPAPQPPDSPVAPPPTSTPAPGAKLSPKMISYLQQLLWDWILPFVVVWIVVKFLCFVVIVPTGSMIPTIDSGSLLIALRVHNPQHTVQRGDILVFYSQELENTLVKRVIGMPGDRVVVDNKGEVTINGQPYPEAYVRNASGKTGIFQVPPGSYLFMGDNRSGSLDARDWDNPYIQQEHVQGKAVFTIWPLMNFGVLK